MSVGDGLLGQVVVDDQGVFTVVSEPFSHGASREGSQELQRSGLGSSSSHDNGVLHGVVLLEGLDELSDCRSLLSDGDIDTIELLDFIASVVPLLLVENGVDGNGGFTGLTITNDQLSLTSTDLTKMVSSERV